MGRETAEHLGQAHRDCAAVGEDQSQTVVARATFDEAGNALKDVNVIFRAMPPLPRSQSANGGGRIAFARDGNLFVTIGDRSQSPPFDMAQKLDNHLGKMLRISNTAIVPTVWE